MCLTLTLTLSIKVWPWPYLVESEPRRLAEETGLKGARTEGDPLHGTGAGLQPWWWVQDHNHGGGYRATTMMVGTGL